RARAAARVGAHRQRAGLRTHGMGGARLERAGAALLPVTRCAADEGVDHPPPHAGRDRAARRRKLIRRDSTQFASIVKSVPRNENFAPVWLIVTSRTPSGVESPSRSLRMLTNTNRFAGSGSYTCRSS